ncbi:hypothetical protein QA645_40685 [Bradyrhizobium sp. CIAT3101]|uniref:hypothetical protein n=1 Tax=Bradyrhizobium sp. CIAT3101 TaxID=439387 RepID=UPI0024B20810|nr:hypothetical protein [Bradyrhizobium sp. CIAT3101]WFU80676.1 hypothetical protein QA645_40685 [Bradyrhizobium sp. CIAT3101]
MKQLFAKFTQKMGARRILIEAENPHCIPLEDPYQKKSIQRSARRIYLLQRVLGASFIDDPAPAAAYTRPASDDGQKVRSSLLLGFVPIEPEPASFFNPDRKAIRIERYRQLYLELMQLDYGAETLVPTPNQLTARYPAIRDFMARTNAYPSLLLSN